MGIVVYDMARPTRGARVRWALEEVGLPYEVKVVVPDEPAFLEVNPMGKVPAITVDGEVMTESGPIGFWVADQVPERGLAPTPGSWERAQCERWTAFVLTELEQACWTKAKHSFALPAELRVPEVKPSAVWEFERASRVLEGALDGREHLVGDRFTVADLMATHTLMWAKHAGFDVSAPLAAYMMRHMARPAFARSMSVR